VPNPNPQASADPKVRLALAREVVAKLIAGNKRYVDHESGKRGKSDLRNTSGVEMLEADPLIGAKAPMAVVVSCARSCGAFGSACMMFDTAPGELQMIRTMSNNIGTSGSIIGSIELALGLAEAINELPPVLLVVGNTQNDVVEEAVIRAMTAQGRGNSCPKPKVFKGQQDAPLVLLDQMVKVARDALDQQPNATFVRLCELTTKLNMYQSIENMMMSSRYIFNLVAAEQIWLLAGVFDMVTKRVSFLGEHPSKARLLKSPPPFHYVRTAADEVMPAEEALAVLYSGNQRYICGQGGILNQTVDQVQLRNMTAESGQNPQAIVLGCADSRAPLEIFFDVKPGDLFVLRNAGNTCPSSRDMMIGSAEYAILVLRTKLVVVTGHTKCGAVNAALQTVQQYAKERGLEHLTPEDITNMIASLEGSSGSIGNVLQNIVRNAAEAIRQLPDGTMKEQAELAIEINVFSTIEKLIQNSEVLRKGVASGDLMVHGTVYNISSGAVKWLGPHPRLQEIVQAEMPLHMWNTTPYVRSEAAAPSAAVEEIITRLKEGNERFMNGETLSADGQNKGSLSSLETTVEFEVGKVTKFEDGIAPPPGRGTLGGKLGKLTSASLDFLPQFPKAQPTSPNSSSTIGRRVRSTTMSNLLAGMPSSSSAIDPFAIVLAGAEKNTAVERIFDVLRTPSLLCCCFARFHAAPHVRPGHQLRLRALLATLPPSLYAYPSLCAYPFSLPLPLSVRLPVSECDFSCCWQRASSSSSATWASSRAAGTVRCSSR
jgi:carbonic anhydrase